MGYRIAKSTFLFATCFLLATSTLPDESSAASYKQLVSKGYKTSKMSKSASGAMGWYVTGKGKRFFCKMRGGAVYIGNSQMGVYSSSGRLIKTDRAAYHRSLGVKKTDAPQLKNLKAGRLRPGDVGTCTFVN
jgi:hypothetical protein